MKNRFLLLTSLLVLAFSANSQTASDCPDGDNGCNSVTNGFPISASGLGLIDEFNGNTNNISNPGTNPNTAPGNAGCLLSGEINSTWVTIYVQQSGNLEFTLGANGGTGFLDWAMWDNTNGNACNDIVANTLAPVACNWNGSSAGFTGMADPNNLPTGANPTNFENPISVTAGQSFTLMFSNFSSVTAASIPLNFVGSAVLGCDPTVPKNLDKCFNIPLTVDYSLQLPPNVTSAVAVPPANITIAPPNVTFSTNVDQAYEIIWTSPDSTWSDSAYIKVQAQLLPTTISDDDTACIGVSIPLTGTLGNTNTDFTWIIVNALGQATILPSPNTTLTPSIVSNLAGNYQVVFLETDTNSICPSVSDTSTFTFSEEIHNTTFTDPTCNGYSDGEITINSIGTLGAVEYSIDNGMTWSTNNVFSNLPFGVYEVISRDIAGCTFATQVTLTDPDPITISVSNDTTVCENGTASLVASSTNANFFNWNFTPSTVGNQFVSPINDSTVSVYATNFNNCSSDTLLIDISLHDTIGVSINANTTICPEDPASKRVVATGGYQNYDYSWTENGAPIGFATPQINMRPALQTDYCVTVSDQCETTPKTICSRVSMFPVPIPQFTSEIIENCEPNAIVAFNVTTPDSVFNKATVSLASTILEMSNDPSNILSRADTIIVPSSGLYDFYLSVTTINGCEANITVEDHIYIDPLPYADFYITPERATIFQPVFDLVNLSNGDNITFDWEFKGGSPTFSTETNPTVAYPENQAKEYPISLLVTSEPGCKSRTQGIAIVENDVVIYAPNSFSPDDDEHNNTWRVYIEGIDQYDFHLQIFNRWGELVFESFDPNAEWDGTLLSEKSVLPGTYVWVIETRDQSNSEVIEFRGTVNVFK